MNYLSVCSGIEAASVAWEPLGWKPLAFSEIEPFPAAVLAHHWPSVPNLGDMTNYEEWKLDSVGLLVGGTPCQSFSVAGLRKGLKDPRGGLMLTYLEIARRFRPRWIVWENVPGVLSSNGGRDFGSFLGALGELGYGWAYRVLDAQWVRTQRHPRAVAQRRRRVFVVGCLGDRTRAAKVLFESQSVCRDSQKSGKTRKGAAGTSSRRTARWSGDVAGSLDTECGGNKLTHQTLLNGHAIVGSLSAEDGEQGHTTVQAAKSGMLVPAAFTYSGYSNKPAWITGGRTDCLSGSGHHDSSHQGIGVMVPARMVAFGEYVEDGTASAMKARDYKDATDLVSHSLRAEGFDASEDGTGRGTPLVPVGIFQDSEFGVAQYDTAGSLRAGRIPEHQMVLQQQAVAFAQNQRDEVRAVSVVAKSVRTMSGGIDREDMHTLIAVQDVTDRDKKQNGRGWNDDGTSYTLDAAATQGVAQVQWASGGGQLENPTAQALRAGAEHSYQFARLGMAVRRLTPLECERLQGFDDNHTLIPWKKKPADQCPDGPRYKALGNSMAVNCMEWIGQRIDFYDKQ